MNTEQMEQTPRVTFRKEELADLYSSLAFFKRMYDNAEAEIQIVMAAIEKVYHEEYPKKPLNTKYLENHRERGENQNCQQMTEKSC